MEHKYSKYKVKNLPYAKVGRRVFRSLFDAETYCTEHGFDVDLIIEYGDSEELKNNIKKIAMDQKAVLEGVLEALDKRGKQFDEELRLAVNKRDKAKETHDFILGYYEEKVKESIDKSQGLYEAKKVVWDMLKILEWLTNWKRY